MGYLKWHEKIISDFSDHSINSAYSQGYFFGRTAKGALYQTRSLRICLDQFELSSENRRILKKTEAVSLLVEQLPYAQYHWSIGKMGKDFYTQKFGDGTFSANKIKELMTDESKSNFNRVLMYRLPEPHPLPLPLLGREAATKLPPSIRGRAEEGVTIGYCIALETSELVHYSYPFYILDSKFDIPNLGLGMMLRAIIYTKEQGKKYIYLGSAQRPSDTYKLQFAGVEWFDGKEWKKDLDELKLVLTQNSNAKSQI